MSIEEIAAASGVPVRTIRFYITNRLLPGPGARGRAAAYGEEHLLRFRLIGLLVEQHVPLEKIRQRLEGLTMADLQAVLAEEPARAALEQESAATSPRDYITGLLRRARQERFADTAARYQPRADAGATCSRSASGFCATAARRDGTVPGADAAVPATCPQRHCRPAWPSPFSAPMQPPAPAPAPPAMPHPSGQGWRRWELAPGVELQVREMPRSYTRT